MSTFVLVHGSWRDGSVWNRVINRLQHHGHNAFGPTVAGHGNGVVLNDGESLLEAVPPHYRALFEQLADASPDNTVMLPFSIWREAFINDADLDVARASYEQLSPEPYQQMTEPLDLRTFYTLDMPRSYLNGTEDIALPQGEWGWHPRMSSRLGLYRLVQMPGSHEVIFTDPNGLADKIIEAGRD